MKELTERLKQLVGGRKHTFYNTTVTTDELKAYAIQHEKMHTALELAVRSILQFAVKGLLMESVLIELEEVLQNDGTK